MIGAAIIVLVLVLGKNYISYTTTVGIFLKWVGKGRSLCFMSAPWFITKDWKVFFFWDFLFLCVSLLGRHGTLFLSFL